MATTSSGSVTTSTVNGTSRITGLSSGLDVDSIVKGLMDAEKVKLYKMEQQEDLLTWKQDAYRTTMGTMNTFSSTYLDTLTSGSITKQGTFLQYDAESSDTAYVTAAASANAKVGSHTLAVSQLATAGTLSSGGAVTGTANPTYGTTGTWAVTVNGTNYTVNLSSSITDLASLQSAVDSAVGSNKLRLGTTSSGNLTVTATNSSVQSYTVGIQSSLGIGATATTTPTYGSGSWSLTVNGTAYTVDLSSATDLATLQSAVDTTCGSGKLTIGTNSSGYLTVTAGSGVSSYVVGAQSSLGFGATPATTGTTKGVQGSTAPTYGFTSGTTWTMYVDEKSYSVDLSSVTDTTTLQAAINKAVGSGKVTVGTTSGCLTLTPADSGVQYISVATQNLLGFTTSGVLANRITTSQTLSTINSSLNSSFSFNSSDEISFTINGESFTFDKDDTLSALMSTVNKSDAGVTMSYDSINDKILLTSKTMGAGATLTASDNASGGTFISTLLNCDLAGKDSKLTLDGQALTRNSNTVTVDGVTYTLNKVTTSDITIGVTQNTDATFDAITKFVNGYNTLIDTIRGKLTEKYSRDYQPLTDAQKSSMSDSDITAWEKKAKTGLLQRDDMLQSFLDELRSAFMASVPGVSQTLKTIGITSSSYSDYGKLTIDESTLKTAIKSDPEGIMNLFSQKSTSYSTSSVRSLSGTEQAVRYKEEGYGMRFYDIFQKYVGTSRDSAGNKGLLVEKAGLADDASASDNSLSDQLDDMKERITNEEKRLSLVQTRYYTEYTNMETYLNKLTTQMSVFSNNSSG